MSHKEFNKTISANEADVSPSENPNSLIGKTVANRWHILKLLGEGNMSTVYEAKDSENSIVVLKFIHKRYISNIKINKLFDDHVKILANLQHPNLARFLNVHISSGGPTMFLVAEYLSGESLETRLSKTGHLSLSDSATIFKQVCEGLACLHENKILHLNLKPSNVVLTKTPGEAKLVDFVASLLSASTTSFETRDYMMHSKQMLCSPMYLSPEQCAGKQPDQRSDIYSLGCLMYETIAGKPPFVGKNVLEAAYKHMHETAKPLANEINIENGEDNLLERFQTIIFKCLEKEPDNRYQTVSQLGHDLSLMLKTTDFEWKDNAFALKQISQPKTKIGKWSKPWRIALTIISGITILGIAVLAILAYLPTPGDAKYPAFDNNLLWVLVDKHNEVNEQENLSKQENLLKETLDSYKSENSNNQEYTDTLLWLIRVNMYNGNWQTASSNLRNLLKIKQKNTTSISTESVADIYKNLAFSEFMQDHFVQAESYCFQAIDLVEKQGNHAAPILVKCYRILGDIYSRKGDLKKAANAYETLVNMIEPYKIRFPGDFAVDASKLADIYRRQNDLVRAERLYKSALICYRSRIKTDTKLLTKMLYGLGLVLEQEQKWKEARMCLKDAFPIAQDTLGQKAPLTGAIKKAFINALWHTDIPAAITLKFG